jgi:biopolymer transport protein ExbB
LVFGVALLLWSAAVGGWSRLVLAQDPPPAEAPAADAAAEAAPAGGAAGTTSSDEAPESQSTLEWLIETSGWIGAILLLISIYFVAKITQLFVELRPRMIMPEDLLAQFNALAAKRDYEGMYALAKEDPSELAQLVAAGLSALSAGIDEARDAIDRLGELITVEMEKKISMLAVIGTLGPMIGLLGTLKGMISSFGVIAMSEAQLKASEVAGGISEALVLTFEGVALSIPAIYFFAVFKNRVSTLSLEAINEADDVVRKVYLASRTRAPRQEPGVSTAKPQ